MCVRVCACARVCVKECVRDERPSGRVVVVAVGHELNVSESTIYSIRVSLFISLGCTQHAEVPWPGTEPMPRQ